MIEVAKEKIITLQEAAEHCKVSLVTVERWHRKGVGTRRLEVVKIGGSIRTSMEALARFAEHPQERKPVSFSPPMSAEGREDLAYFAALEEKKRRNRRGKKGEK